MNVTDIAAHVRAALARGLGVEEGSLRPTTSLYEDLGADSLAVMEVLSRLEDQLGIALPDSNSFAMSLRTVGDLVEAFESRASQTADARQRGVDRAPDAI